MKHPRPAPVTCKLIGYKFPAGGDSFPRRLTFLGLLLAALVPSGHARDKAPDGLYDGYTGFALPAEPVLPTRETHPSLWFTAAELPALKTRLTVDDFARSRWAAVQKLVDLAKPLPPPPAASDKVEIVHKYYGAMSLAARAHAFVALFAEDAAARAAHRQRAVELLRRAYDGPIFELDSKVKGSAVDEIYRGSWLQNYAHAYDCVQPSLSPADNEAIRARLAREAQCVFENLYAWTDTSPHNHLSKPAWGLGSIALTLASDPRAKAWLARAIEAANRNTRYFFSADGIYREGSHYLVFSLTNFVPFLYHYRNVSGVDGFQVFQPAFENMVQVRNSRGWLPNIEDSYLRPTPTHLVAAAYRTAKTKLHSSAPLAEILAWSYATCDVAAFAPALNSSGYNYTGASLDYSLELDELLTHDASLKATAPDCPPNVFLAGGQTVLRNGWTSGNAGQRYLLFHGVAVADNHNHDDQLSFILQAEGQMMCSDSGYSRGTYTGAERTDWYITAAAHNTLTFDGQPAGSNASNDTPLSAHWEQPGLVVVEKTQFKIPKGGVWRRTLCWIGGDYYAVVDRVDSKVGLDLKSYLHGGRGTMATAGPEHTWVYSADRYGPAARLRCWIVAPGATTEVKDGELTYIKDDYAAFPYLVTSYRAGAPAITLLKPAAASETAPFTVEDHSGAGFSALVVTTATEKTVLVAAAAPTAVVIDGVETDAAFAIVRRDKAGKVLNHLRRDGGSYLRVDGRELAP
ncbi:MAG TPA: heparinase II/III family protein [Lacunisphaera sp.]|nr:heparinase II/III family protein [Lacunisphaera sp.]